MPQRATESVMVDVGVTTKQLEPIKVPLQGLLNPERSFDLGRAKTEAKRLYGDKKGIGSSGRMLATVPKRELRRLQQFGITPISS